MKRRGPLFKALKPDEIGSGYVGWGWKTIGWNLKPHSNLKRHNWLMTETGVTLVVPQLKKSLETHPHPS